MTVVKSEPYILNDNNKQGIEAEAFRLDFQHAFMTDMMDNQLLPQHITMELHSNPAPRICEIATGTGIWLKELAKTLPAKAELVGLDYDTTKFPAADKLPSNVKLGYGNAFEPFPEELRGSFDVVHLRLFVFAVKRGQSLPLLENLITLLRPGGWLVWVDVNPLIMNAEPPHKAHEKFKRCFYDFANKVDLSMEIPVAIPAYMQQAGLEDCDARFYSSETPFYGPKGGAEWRARQQYLAFIGIRQAIKGMYLMGGIEGVRTEGERDGLINELQGIFTDGNTKFHMPTMRACGRRPF
ncbi:S-adenosyl-L-methionine-dependent methyltransferase [Xylariaceae sp. FL0594]|nr:S-adenosyl-L-methionine-dependent methyltransferase [Xylariaceae sp. FL0594]